MALHLSGGIDMEQFSFLFTSSISWVVWQGTIHYGPSVYDTLGS